MTSIILTVAGKIAGKILNVDLQVNYAKTGSAIPNGAAFMSATEPPVRAK